MHAYLEQQILTLIALVQRHHCLAHADSRRDGAIRRRESRHHRVADRLDNGASLGRDNLVQHLEMRAHDIESGQVADALIEFGRASQVGKQGR
jgi:hypothetical protein